MPLYTELTSLEVQLHKRIINFSWTAETEWYENVKSVKCLYETEVFVLELFLHCVSV